MQKELRSDLALERRAADESLDGTHYREKKRGVFTLSELIISDQSSAEALGRPIGRYETVSFPAPSLLGDGARGALVSLLAERLSLFCQRLCRGSVQGGGEVLLVALGNAHLTCDSLGPAVAERISATAHLKAIDPDWFAALGAASLRILTPGVLASSGIEAVALAASLCLQYPPALVIAVDALAARERSRLLRTVQISDSGITPGSGVDGQRKRLDRDTLGAPVLTVGVPTVIDYPDPEGGSFLVTPKEIDTEIRVLSRLLSCAISRVLRIPEEL